MTASRDKKQELMKSQDNRSYDRTNDITVDEVRKLATFKDWSDERIERMISVLKKFCNLIFSVHSRQKKNGKVIATKETQVNSST